MSDPINLVDFNGLEIFIGFHPIGSGSGLVWHAFIYVVPDNGTAPFTLGGGPDTPLGTRGPLVGGVNRPTDTDRRFDFGFVRVPIPPGCTEFEILRRLVDASAAHGDNLPYDIVPTPWNDGYNSNSLISGLLQATGITPPSFPTAYPFPVPGYGKPVPIDAFRGPGG